MRREGDTLVFEPGEDVVYGDLRLSNKGGYEVELDLSEDGEVEGISVSSDEGFMMIGIDCWFESGLSLDDPDVFATDRERRANKVPACWDVWGHVE